LLGSGQKGNAQRSANLQRLIAKGFHKKPAYTQVACFDPGASAPGIDQLDIQLSDHDGQLAIPPKGAVIRLWLGWSDTGLVDKGTYTTKLKTQDGKIYDLGEKQYPPRHYHPGLAPCPECFVVNAWTEKVDD